MGTLPGVAQQNAFLGLPLTLMREETAYLVRTGVAHLVPLKPDAQYDRASVDVQTQARLRKLREQARRSNEEKEKKEREAQAMQRGGEAAREKREARARLRAAKEAARRQAQGGEELFGDHQDTPPAPLPSAPQTNDTSTAAPQTEEQLDISNHFHLVPSHPSSSNAYGPPITSLPHPLFPFPLTERDRALLDTFTELQHRGLRMGLGPRFGGEYLIYPGDYLRYHAHFTSQVIVGEEPIRPAEIVAWGRLGTGTKKAGLLCCWEGDETSSHTTEASPSSSQKPGVEFYSLEWANFG